MSCNCDNQDDLFRAGDLVKVWSLQSFHGGGFLNGVDAVVKQDQLPNSSVIVAVERNINGKRKLDPSYEVYPQQLRRVHRPTPSLSLQHILDLLRSM